MSVLNAVWDDDFHFSITTVSERTNTMVCPLCGGEQNHSYAACFLKHPHLTVLVRAGLVDVVIDGQLFVPQDKLSVVSMKQAKKRVASIRASSFVHNSFTLLAYGLDLENKRFTVVFPRVTYSLTWPVLVDGYGPPVKTFLHFLRKTVDQLRVTGLLEWSHLTHDAFQTQVFSMIKPA